jgi:hypothetical protein
MLLRIATRTSTSTTTLLTMNRFSCARNWRDRRSLGNSIRCMLIIEMEADSSSRIALLKLITTQRRLYTVSEITLNSLRKIMIRWLPSSKQISLNTFEHHIHPNVKCAIHNIEMSDTYTTPLFKH